MNTKPIVQSFGNPIADLAATLMGFQPVVQRPDNLVECAHCGVAPEIDPCFHGKVCIWCDTDACEGDGTDRAQATGNTLTEAVAKWNDKMGDANEAISTGAIK